METMSPQMPQKSNGALVGSIIIIIILVLGGVYILMKNKPTQNELPGSLADQTTQDSKDLDGLEDELKGMNLETLDSEV